MNPRIAVLFATLVTAASILATSIACTSSDEGEPESTIDFLNLHLDGYVVPETEFRERLSISMITLDDPGFTCGNLLLTPPATDAMTRAIEAVGVRDPEQQLDPVDGERVRRIFVEECEAFRSGR